MILIRDIFRALLGALSRCAMLLATLAFLTAVALAVISGYLVTFPITRAMHLSPRSSRLHAAGDVLNALFKIASTFQPPPE